MSTPRSSFSYIAMLTLLPAIALAWSSIVAPCIEIGFFWVSLLTALSVSLYAWRHGNRIGQASMFLVYCLLACSILLAVTSVVDLTNFSILGEHKDAESGVLMGGLLAFSLMAVISIRLSKRFPAALAWAAFVASLMVVYFSVSSNITALLPDYNTIATATFLVGGLLAFIAFSRYKENLNDSQYLSVLSIIVFFIAVVSPSAKDNLAAGFAASLVQLLAGVLFFSVRRNVSANVRIAGMMLLYIGFDSVAQNGLQKWLGVSGILAGIPSLLFCILFSVWIKFRMDEIPRGLYWVALFTFSYIGILGVIPEVYSDILAPATLPFAGLFVMVCMWYAPSSTPSVEQTWRIRFRNVCAAFGVAFVLVVSAAWFKVSLDMLIYNSGPALLIARLKNTPLWLGDAVFVRLAMREMSLWPEDVGNYPSEKLSLEQYLKAIRPCSDRFSFVMDTKRNQQKDQGVVNKCSGIRWGALEDNLNVAKVECSSPAGNVGLTRGDRVVAVNGMWLKDIKDEDAWHKLFGDWNAGKIVSVRVLTLGGTNKDVLFSTGITHQDPPVSSIITTATGNRVGYLYLESFNTDQFKKIKYHFAIFKKEGVRDLVLDLRYNSGGAAGNAAMLANLIAGQALDGKLFVREENALRHEDLNSEFKFKRLPESLHTRRLVVLTTDETCSASETIINCLRPYLPVYTVGTTTCGKPYGMREIDFGENTLSPVTYRLLNSRGEGGYTNGIRADYISEDDLTHQLGDPQEGMLKKALEVLGKDTLQ